MDGVSTSRGSATVRVRNIGGISETEVEIPPGVTVLEGRNATNRTSFLRSLMGVMGSDDVELKGDSDRGSVQLTLGGETYRRELRSEDGSVAFDGDPYLDDPTTADLFAFLLESNEARRAVARGDDLRELIMRPVDVDDIQDQIRRIKRRRDQVDEQLEEIDGLKDELPRLEERRAELEAEIDDKRERLREKEADIDSADAEVADSRAEQQELETRLQELRDARSRLEDVRSDIARQEESITSLRQERSSLREEREALPEEPPDDGRDLEAEIARLRERKQTLETEVSELRSVIQFNEGMLEDEQFVGDALGADDGARGDPTEQLVGATGITCWTCGSEVERDRIADTCDELRSVRTEKVGEVRELEDRIDDLREEKAEVERTREEAERIDARIEEVGAEIDRRTDRIERLREQRTEISEEIEDVEAAVEELEEQNFSEILDLHREANQIEFDLEQLESELDDLTDRIDTVESRIADEPELTDRRERLSEELEDQRTRIERIERQAVEAFNTHMETVLNVLQYRNVSRIWIERVQRRVREGRETVDRTAFELHVVRTTESGTAYQDTVDHLSESEREVTGLVFALAGYLVHDVHETVPFMVLDSLEALDARRIGDLIPYLAEHTEYLVVALLPEDAQYLPEEYARVENI